MRRRTGRTYNEWLALGLQVRKGEKATGRSADGKATFTKEQTKSKTEPYSDPGDYDQEEADFYNYDGYHDNVGDR